MRRPRPPGGEDDRRPVLSRRRLLAGLSGLTVAGGAGCAGRGPGATPPATADDPGTGGGAGTDTGDGAGTDTGDGTGTPSLAAQGFPPTVCSAEIIEDFSIRAIDDPAYAPDWSGTDPAERYGDLTGDSVVVGLRRDGRARAYPVSVLWVHEVVNGGFGGPVLVTYCPLCRSGLVAERRVRGTPATFGVSGQLWQPPQLQVRASEADDRTFAADPDEADLDEVRATGNLVMYDDVTRSYWSQILGQAICGPMAGTRLDIVASEVTTWAEWRAANPGTDVLVPPPASGTM